MDIIITFTETLNLSIRNARPHFFDTHAGVECKSVACWVMYVCNVV